MSTDLFKNIRPFNSQEIQEKLPELKERSAFNIVLDFIFPNATETYLNELLSSIQSAEDFQSKISKIAIDKILLSTTISFDCEGIDKLDPNETYLFISNHRDIVLDSALLSYTLLNKGFKSNQSAIGDNLVFSQTFEYIAKMNKNFIVKRGGSPRELFKNSQLLSKYIESQICEKESSIWIAQREGRAKDGDDKTQTSLLKMLGINQKGNLVDYLKSLRIVPIGTSYEYDPTDIMKISSLLAKSKEEEYIKEEKEDVANIVAGIKGFKGAVKMVVGNPLNKELDALREISQKSEFYQKLAQIVDAKIIEQYALHKTNYMAYDILHKTNIFSAHYTEVKIDAFEQNIWLKAKMFGKEAQEVYEILLKMYANPLINKIKDEA